MTTNDIDAIRARADAAGSGPWWVANLLTPTGPDLWQVTIMRTIDTPDGPRDEQVCAVEYETCGFQYPHFDAQSDAAFIAHARTDVPALLAKVAELTAERDAARKDRDDYADDNTRVAVALVDVQRKLAATEAERDAARDMANTARHEATQALHALDKARAVVEAAKTWRDWYAASPVRMQHLSDAEEALFAAVDALPTANTDDQPCCGYRCQDNTTGVTTQPTEPTYLIWSAHHQSWWGPNRRGYRSNPADAGRYTLADAQAEMGRGCDCCQVPEVPVAAGKVVGEGDRAVRDAIAQATEWAVQAGQGNKHYTPKVVTVDLPTEAVAR